MEIIYHGHSCVEILSGDQSLIIDPFLTGNLMALAKPSDIRAQTILLTHGHPDHVGDALEIAAASNGTIICSYEMSFIFRWKGIKSVGMGRNDLPSCGGYGLVRRCFAPIRQDGEAFVHSLEAVAIEAWIW